MCAQFEIPQPTSQYQLILEAAPTTFIGSCAHLQSTVQLLCAEVGGAPRGQGRENLCNLG